MATSGEGGNPSGRAMPRPLAQLKVLEPRVARRRLSQARHRATLAGLFSNLRKAVYFHSDLTASKWQVLNRAKAHIQELEQTLDNLLKLKESFNLEDGNANSLEEAKREYASMYSRNPSLVSNKIYRKGSDTWCPIEAVGKDPDEEEEDEEEEEEDEEEEEEEEEKKVELLHSPVTLLPDLMEFERYLNFYKQTMDLLIGNGIVSSQEVTLPIVSAAISHLWQTLSEERKASLLQAWVQKHSGLPGLAEACPEPAGAEGSVKDSGVDSQGPAAHWYPPRGGERTRVGWRVGRKDALTFARRRQGAPGVTYQEERAGAHPGRARGGGASAQSLQKSRRTRFLPSSSFTRLQVDVSPFLLSPLPPSPVAIELVLLILYIPHMKFCASFQILFEDAFDVASFLDKSEAPSTSSPSSVLAICNPEKPEEKFQLYMQIIDFFKGLCCVNTQFKQEPDLPVDDEMIMLRCMETFDDEDL
ncbi:stimulated by retinoic acid gene 8 protein homolog isoform X1 [Sus scrofa]|uniref:stimulated by retinoic acid gene 8 protein homolog isoform X1 n=1 Tax=Sus scrofa TaxID=9823 RepID=UPI000A2B22A0|nr:stimulated by retinoic acid gene 8 protein homolog isoform X1 [Sus scrofa]